ncbi:MAG: hypothetical protein ACOC7J_02680, partial [Armatimonadota bacterium]
MAVGMFHYNEIARAIRLTCQGATALTEDVTSGTEVSVGSNELFEIGDEAHIRDADGEESVTVVGKVGLTIVMVEPEIDGEYL